MFFNEHGFGEYEGISPTVIRGNKTVPAMMKRYRGKEETCRLHRSSQDLAWCITVPFLSRHLTLTFCFILFFFVRLHTINVCHLMRDQKQGWTVWQGLHWQPCLPAFGPLDLLLVVLGHPVSLSLVPSGSQANNMNSNWLTWLKNSGTQSILHAFCMEW